MKFLIEENSDGHIDNVLIPWKPCAHKIGLKFCPFSCCKTDGMLLCYLTRDRFCVSAEESIDEPSVLLLPHVLVGLGRIISGCRPYRLSQRIYSQVSEEDLLRRRRPDEF